MVNVQLRQYLHTELNIYSHFTEKTKRFAEGLGVSLWQIQRLNCKISLPIQRDNFILWLFAEVDTGIINFKKGPQNRKSREKTLIRL